MIADRAVTQVRPRAAANLVPFITWAAWLAVLATLWALVIDRLRPDALMERWSDVGELIARTPEAPLVDAATLLAGAVLVSATCSSLLAVAAKLSRSARLARVALRLALPALRPALHRLLGTGLLALSAPMVLTGAPAGASDPPSSHPVQERPGDPATAVGPPVLVRLGDQATPPAGTPATSDPPVMRRLPTPAPDADVAAAAELAEAEAEAEAGAGVGAEIEVEVEVAARPPVHDAPATWVIQRGQHLWHVAETVVTEHLASIPTEAQVGTYHQLLIDTNRHELPIPTDPDLIHPGHVLALPPVPD